MDTLAEIVAAAQHLAPGQLSELRREIERLEKASRAICFEPRESGGAAYRLIRLADGEWWELLLRSLAIADQSLTIFWLLWGPSPRLRLGLPAAYLTLKHLSGESGRWFDDYKCSFSFPFALDVEREGRTFPYLFEVRNYGGGFEFPIRRVVDERDARLAERLIHKPFEEEFGEEQIKAFLLRFVIRLVDVWERIRRRRHEPFVQTVPKNQVVFGYCGGKVFEKDYQRAGAYEAALQRYREQVRREQESASGRAVRQRPTRGPRRRRG